MFSLLLHPKQLYCLRFCLQKGSGAKSSLKNTGKWHSSNATLEYILLYGLKTLLHSSVWTHPQTPSHHSATSRHSQLCCLIQGLANSFCKGLDSAYFRLCRPYMTSVATSHLCPCSEKAAPDNAYEWAWLCSNTILLTKRWVWSMG